MARPKLTNWMHPQSYAAARAKVSQQRRWEQEETAFEKFVREHRIERERWTNSNLLRKWCKSHANSRYVPEELLVAFGIDSKPSLFFAHLGAGVKRKDEASA